MQGDATLQCVGVMAQGAVAREDSPQGLAEQHLGLGGERLGDEVLVEGVRHGPPLAAARQHDGAR